MTVYRVEIDRTKYYTIEGIEADSEKEAVEIAHEMIHDDHEDVLQDQILDEEIDVFEAFE